MLIKKFLYSALFVVVVGIGLRCVGFEFLNDFRLFYMIWNFLDDFVVVDLIFGGENCTGFGIWNVENVQCVLCDCQICCI